MDASANPTSSEAAECRCDGELMPRWRGPEVMDDDSEAMGFVCHQCGSEYLPNLVSGRRLTAPPAPGAWSH